MTPNYDIAHEGLAATVAAAAYAVFAIQEAEEQNSWNTRKYLESSRVKTTAIDIKPGRQTVERASNGRSSKGEAAPGDAEITEFPRRRYSYAAGDDAGTLMRVAESEAKADAWEKAQMEKIRKRHEDAKSAILAWETEKKKQAKLSFDKRKQELDNKGKINKQHCQSQITEIDRIARKAMTQAEEKRRDEEFRIKEEKAKRIRSRSSCLTCFCC